MYSNQDYNRAHENSSNLSYAPRYQIMQDGIAHYNESQPSHNILRRFPQNHQQRLHSRRHNQSTMREAMPRRRQHFTENFQDRRREMTTYRGKRRRGCHNCGEQNHHQDHCWFDNRVKCGNCGLLGHKSKLCSLYR